MIKPAVPESMTGIGQLEDPLTGIGHTRWATHGGPTDGQNAHPHLSDGGKLAVIHNGIIENFAELKQELLAKGVTFESETDTEVAAALLGDIFRNKLNGDGRRPHRGNASWPASDSKARSPFSQYMRTSPTSSWPPAGTPRW
jgi:glutamine phosphoribosylpyrophosphate amidotransferase